MKFTDYQQITGIRLTQDSGREAVSFKSLEMPSVLRPAFLERDTFCETDGHPQTNQPKE